jgi:hypothetical protein
MDPDLRRLTIAAFLYFCIAYLPLSGQQISENTATTYSDLVFWAYGQDQELVNGMQYYNKHPRAMGHPYMLEGWTHQGSVRLRGKLYSNIWLKYNIHTQQVEVEYQTLNGGDNQVVLVNDRLDDFTIEEAYFRRITPDKAREHGLDPVQFYQVIGTGRMLWYIQWAKKLVPVSGDSRFIEEFTPPKRSYLLELDGRLHEFSNKKSFVKLFPKDMQKDMKRLIRANYLQFRTADTKQLELFILAAENLLKEGER